MNPRKTYKVIKKHLLNISFVDLKVHLSVKILFQTWPNCGLHNIFVASVAKFNDAYGHSFVMDHKIEPILAETEEKKPFFCFVTQCYLSFKNWPANKNVWPPLFY